MIDWGETSFSDNHNVIWVDEGIEQCDEQAALAVLLRDEIVFVTQGKKGPPCLYLVENDVFAWGYSGYCDFNTSDIHEIYKAHKDNKDWGVIKWICARKNLQPQKPMIKAIKKAGYWDSTFERLKKNDV
jgi:hypothetical protein